MQRARFGSLIYWIAYASPGRLNEYRDCLNQIRHQPPCPGRQQRMSQGPEKGLSPFTGTKAGPENHDGGRLQGVVRLSDEAVTLNILVIDDMERLAILLGAGLKRAGHRVATAFSGQEGLELYSSGSYDLVITDLVMDGGLDGLDVCRTIRAICSEQNRPKTRCILLTGWGSELDEDDPRLSEAGVDLILAKPVELPDLLASLASLTAT